MRAPATQAPKPCSRGIILVQNAGWLACSVTVCSTHMHGHCTQVVPPLGVRRSALQHVRDAAEQQPEEDDSKDEHYEGDSSLCGGVRGDVAVAHRQHLHGVVPMCEQACLRGAQACTASACRCLAG